MLLTGIRRKLIGYSPPFFVFLHKDKHVAATQIDRLAAHIKRHIKIIGDHSCIAVNLDSGLQFLPVMDLGGFCKIVPGSKTGFPSLKSFPFRCCDHNHIPVKVVFQVIRLSLCPGIIQSAQGLPYFQFLPGLRNECSHPPSP